MAISFELERDLTQHEDRVATNLCGIQLLETPLLNKGTAFPEAERRAFGLDGLLPPYVADMEEQLERIYGEFHFKASDMEKHIYLRGLQDRNEVLFYRLLLEHIEEMMPLIYTPTVGAACRHFSHIYRRPRGLFVSYPQREEIARILRNRPVEEVDVIVVTDGERILGLGDQGVGGMGIPIGKLSLYTLCGGIHPARTLPIVLDVGTDNVERLNDPHYLGWRSARVRGEPYFEFVDRFVKAIKEVLPHALLQWEDFSRDHAAAILERYHGELCTFNDDIQGTAAVTVAALLSALNGIGGRLADQRIVLLGAGSAAIGIANQLTDTMVLQGLPSDEAARRFWILNSKGLVHRGMNGLQPFQLRFARPEADLAAYGATDTGRIALAEVVRHVRPTILIGVSGRPGQFTQAIVEDMARTVERPIVLPLSNPTSQAEARPEDLIRWTNGAAIVATGSPFAPVEFGGRRYPIAQCNNSYVFPGLGLGVVASGARRVTPAMFRAASAELAAYSAALPGSPVLPPLSDSREVSRRVALAVGRSAIHEGVAEPMADSALTVQILARMWEPRYPRLVPRTADR